MGHGGVAGTAKWLGMKVDIVEFTVYFAGLDLTEGNLFLDVVDDHQETFTFLSVCAVFVGDGDSGAVVFHHDGW
jgi:hypothetical protein